MKLFIKYIYQFRWNIACFIAFTAIFAAVLFLYDSNVEAVLYAALICAIIAVIIFIWGFLRFREKHKLLREIYEVLPLKVSDIPENTGLIETDMREIALRLSEINNENITKLNSINRENIDYFTVWVHQIKTPISAMQMLLQNDDSDKSRELSAELFRIEQYAEMTLNFIRLDSDTNDLVIKKYPLDDIIRQAVHRYAPLFVRKKIGLEYSPADGDVLTDEKWLLFIIEQLLSNAVKYTFKGTVTIKFENDILTISDTGIGISAEDLPRIFEKGYTGLSGRTEKKSTGLGLYLSKRAADKLGHKLSVKSEVGKGTEFSIDLSSQKINIE